MVVIPHAESLLDQVADHWPRPHAGLIAGLHRPQFNNDRQGLALLFGQLGRRPLGDRSPDPFDVISVVPLEPPVHGAASDTALRSDVGYLSAVDVRTNRTATPPLAEVVLKLGLDDERIELLELSRAAARATDRVSCLCFRHDRDTMILP